MCLTYGPLIHGVFGLAINTGGVMDLWAHRVQMPEAGVVQGNWSQPRQSLTYGPLDTPAQRTEGCMDQNGQIHKEGAVLDVAQIVLNILVDGKGPVGTQLP